VAGKINTRLAETNDRFVTKSPASRLPRSAPALGSEGTIQLFAAAKCDVSEALCEADKALEKFAAAPRECACLRDGGR